MKKILIGFVALIVMYAIGRWSYGEISYAYFEHKCEKDAGEFIYRTVENVEGLFQIRPRDPRDYFSRLRKGDIPEDPFGHTNTEAQRPWLLFVRNPSKGRYQFFESIKGPDLKSYDARRHKEFEPKPVYTGEKYWLYERAGSSQYGSIYLAEQTSELRSRYGFTWREMRDRWDELLGVYGGELIIKELDTDEVLGIRRGYVMINKYSRKGGMCPKIKNDNTTYYFLKKVLIPLESVLQEEEENE